MDLSGIFNYIFTGEHVATLLTIIIAIVIYELMKKSVKKSVAYITRRKTKAGLVIFLIALIGLAWWIL